jgi:hypothetical protein
MSRRDAERLARRIREEHARLAPKLPDIDPDDLALILEALLRPPNTDRCLFAPRIAERR